MRLAHIKIISFIFTVFDFFGEKIIQIDPFTSERCGGAIKMRIASINAYFITAHDTLVNDCFKLINVIIVMPL